MLHLTLAQVAGAQVQVTDSILEHVSLSLHGCWACSGCLVQAVSQPHRQRAGQAKGAIHEGIRGAGAIYPQPLKAERIKEASRASNNMAQGATHC